MKNYSIKLDYLKGLFFWLALPAGVATLLFFFSHWAGWGDDGPTLILFGVPILILVGLSTWFIGMRKRIISQAVPAAKPTQHAPGSKSV